jgi:nucleoside-diphosphate-sugar epimerase
MQAYLWVRALGESMIHEAELTATIVRPWYVLGPGRRWPKAILPLCKLAEALPATRPTAERLGLVTLEQFIKAMVGAAENPPQAGRQRIVDVPAIKSARL